MYDVATKSVSKLDGELSTAFVEAAETNTSNENEDENAPSASNLIETKLPAPDGLIALQDDDLIDDLDQAASEYVEMKVPIIDPTTSDLQADGSEQFERFVDVSGMEIKNPNQDLNVAATNY